MNNLRTVWKGVKHRSTTPCHTLYPHPYTWVPPLEAHIPIRTPPLMLHLIHTPTQVGSIASSFTPLIRIILIIHITHTTIRTSSALPLLLL